MSARFLFVLYWQLIGKPLNDNVIGIVTFILLYFVLSNLYGTPLNQFYRFYQLEHQISDGTSGSLSGVDFRSFRSGISLIKRTL